MYVLAGMLFRFQPVAIDESLQNARAGTLQCWNERVMRCVFDISFSFSQNYFRSVAVLLHPFSHIHPR